MGSSVLGGDGAAAGYSFAVMRGLRGLLVGLATVMLLAVGAASASASSQCGDCTASYSGTWTVSWPFGTSGNAMVTLNFAESLQSGNWSLTSANGSYTEPAQPDNNYPGCNAALTRDASAAAMLGSFGPNVVTRRSGYWTAELFPPTYWGMQGDPVDSSQTTGDCATSARVDYAGLSHSLGGPECHFDPSAGNTEAIDFPVSSSYTVPDNCTGTMTSNGVVYNVTLQSSVTFTSPGVVSPSSPGVALRTPAEVRAWALGEWRSLTPIYIDALAAENGSLAQLNGNIDFVVTSEDSQAMRTYVNSLASKNLLLLKAIREMNAHFERTLAWLAGVINDPPLSGRSPAPVARVTPFRFSPSSCTGIPARSRGFCTRLQRDAAAWIDAGATLEALARALATDVGRESAARWHQRRERGHSPRAGRAGAASQAHGRSKRSAARWRSLRRRPARYRYRHPRNQEGDRSRNCESPRETRTGWSNRRRRSDDPPGPETRAEATPLRRHPRCQLVVATGGAGLLTTRPAQRADRAQPWRICAKIVIPTAD